MDGSKTQTSGPKPEPARFFFAGIVAWRWGYIRPQVAWAACLSFCQLGTGVILRGKGPNASLNASTGTGCAFLTRTIVVSLWPHKTTKRRGTLQKRHAQQAKALEKAACGTRCFRFSRLSPCVQARKALLAECGAVLRKMNNAPSSQAHLSGERTCKTRQGDPEPERERPRGFLRATNLSDGLWRATSFGPQIGPARSFADFDPSCRRSRCSPLALQKNILSTISRRAQRSSKQL